MALLLGGYFLYVGAFMSDEDGKPLIPLEGDSFDIITVSMNEPRCILMSIPHVDF